MGFSSPMGGGERVTMVQNPRLVFRGVHSCWETQSHPGGKPEAPKDVVCGVGVKRVLKNRPRH